jgi:hypothetical protein
MDVVPISDYHPMKLMKSRILMVGIQPLVLQLFSVLISTKLLDWNYAGIQVLLSLFESEFLLKIYDGKNRMHVS